ncbi:hypothetical protein COE81_23480 [Bacillus wiedmannii]|uniref:hypothetical protein n=1 Tax=Bacillus wiedmannii TaxID=1890302 RepID=UPI000BFD8148|nr:hypothetical protein [Bacillus wiedmannii]PHB04320.1 hypothetical protein COE81_23480 [Bacillus wiedmannii]
MNFDVQIEEKRKEKQKILDQMKIKKEIFLEELIKFTINWFEEQTILTIKSEAEKVIELGEEKAKELKGRIKELKENSPKLVEQYMVEDSLWWHTNEDKEFYYLSDRRLMDKHLEKIRLMFGELGKILIEYGIEKARSDYDRSHISSWSYEGYTDKSKLKYSYSIDFSKELYDINNEYLDLIKKAQDVNEQIKKLEEKKKKENVEEWWKSL